MKALRIMTINVWSGLDYKGTLRMGEYETPEMRESRFRALVREIGSLSPDIIGINEANFISDYVERLGEILGYEYIYHVGLSGLRIWRIGIPWNLQEGDAILARKGLCIEYVGRKQLSGDGFVWNYLSFHKQNATQVLVGKMTLNRRAFFLALTHWRALPRNDDRNQELLRDLKEKFGYSEKEYRTACLKLERDDVRRMNEAKLMVSYLKECVPEGSPLIVMGDFNAEIESPEMQYLIERGFYDTYSVVAKDKGYTWNIDENENIKKFYHKNLERRSKRMYEHLNDYGAWENKRIDFILANACIPAESVIHSKVCARNAYGGVHPSDHFGVFTVILC